MAEIAGIEIYTDTSEHVDLILRILDISADVWRCTIRRFAETWHSGCRDLYERASALEKAYQACSPYAVQAASRVPSVCSVCLGRTIFPAYARLIKGQTAALEYGCCNACGHGQLLSQPAALPTYYGPDYYRCRRPDGSGYQAYEAEREYREARATRLLKWIWQSTGICSGRLLEVGSGLGFTRHAAERLGFTTEGVDINHYAAERARVLYGIDTFTGTLAEARQANAVLPGCDVVLYQFVLEHLENPEGELLEVADVLKPGGLLALTIPSMDALELKVFGGSYRSFRSDHRHVFSRRSIRRLLQNVGFDIVRERSECSSHLLAGFYSSSELEILYDSGLGPDLHIVARKVS
jgi:SAM-dependent methyltransferase